MEGSYLVSPRGFGFGFGFGFRFGLHVPAGHSSLVTRIVLTTQKAISAGKFVSVLPQAFKTVPETTGIFSHLEQIGCLADSSIHPKCKSHDTDWALVTRTSV